MKFSLLTRLSFFLILLSTFAKADSNKVIDSLITELARAKNDTDKIILYGSIIFLSSYSDQDLGLKYVSPALQLAEKLKWKNGIIHVKSQVGILYWRMGKFEDALKYHFEALQLSIETGNEESSINLLISIGQDYADGGKYTQALFFFKKAQRKCEVSGDKYTLATIHNLLAWVYVAQGNYAESTQSNYQSLSLYEELGDKMGIGISLSNLAEDYKTLGNYQEAIKFCFKGLKLLKEAGDKINECHTYNTIGDIYRTTGDYKKALQFHFVAMKIGREISDNAIVANSLNFIGKVYKSQNNYSEALKYFLLSAEKNRLKSNSQELSSLYSNIGNCYTNLNDLVSARIYLDSALILSKELNSNISFIDYYRSMELLDSFSGDWESAYKNYKNYIVAHDSSFKKENINRMVSTQMKYDEEIKVATLKAEQEKKDIIQRNIRNSFIAGFTGSIIFLLVVYRQRNKIKKEKKRSEELLLNILPEEVAEELKAKGSAEAKLFDEVTVMFTDFKGFTGISEKLTPAELVSEIHHCFKAFDDIISRHNIEKIKTIGDSYMCAGGLPVTNETHAFDVVRAALEILQFMNQHLEKRKKEGKEIFEIRIGIHTGPVVAGIVGVKKFAYDIWGDTVNTASRMESSGEPGKVNISETTYAKIKDEFTCIPRGKVNAKNKGEIEMYFVEAN